MDTGSNAIVFFFGLFWAVSLNSVARYRPFETASFWSPTDRQYAFRRFVLAIVILNLLPVFWLWVLFQFIVPKLAGFFPVLSAAIASLSIFGIPRLFHAFVATDRGNGRFYSNEEYMEITKRWREGSANTFVSHFVPGILYLIVFAILGYLLGRLS